MTLTILYRNNLTGCNYTCSYCPFHQKKTEVERKRDCGELGAFVKWVRERGSENREDSIFFTPAGEVLVLSWYREAIRELAGMPHVKKVAVQTNLSSPLEWLAGCEKGKVGIWATYHPGQVTQREFLMQCRRLDEKAISYSVGMVGIKEQIPEIRAMRKKLPESTYLWVNAYKEIPGYYSKGEVEQLEVVDPLFRYNLEGFKSRGRGCRCGEAVVSIYGDGTVKRCHFEKKIIGN
ncbi:MAG: radical SAM protein, partial [bacterium]|nr:radical SAM protein [bacterium]